jgi:hypothetical protein
MYCDATVAVDVAGALLGPVPIRRGVLQGNPLSPALFNIYLDGAIERLEQLGRKGVAQALRPLGIFLPRVSGSVRSTCPALSCQRSSSSGAAVNR